mgnify:FL=1
MSANVGTMRAVKLKQTGNILYKQYDVIMVFPKESKYRLVLLVSFDVFIRMQHMHHNQHIN